MSDDRSEIPVLRRKPGPLVLLLVLTTIASVLLGVGNMMSFSDDLQPGADPVVLGWCACAVLWIVAVVLFMVAISDKYAPHGKRAAAFQLFYVVIATACGLMLTGSVYFRPDKFEVPIRLHSAAPMLIIELCVGIWLLRFYSHPFGRVARWIARG